MCMKNKYMEAQCQNMLNVIAVFNKACDMAALEDDGVVSKEEAKKLKKIRRAAGQFQAELLRVMS